jgi:hypothetical protein
MRDTAGEIFIRKKDTCCPASLTARNGHFGEKFTVPLVIVTIVLNGGHYSMFTCYLTSNP